MIHGKQFICDYSVISPNKLHVEITEIKTEKKQEEVVTISNTDILKTTYSILGFMLEEYEYGLYKRNITLKQLIESAISQATQQLELA